MKAYDVLSFVFNDEIYCGFHRFIKGLLAWLLRLRNQTFWLCIDAACQVVRHSLCISRKTFLRFIATIKKAQNSMKASKFPNRKN